MSPRQTALRRYDPWLLALGGVLLFSCSAWYSYHLLHAGSQRRETLRRSNARRRNRRSQGAPPPDPGAVLTNEQLHDALNGGLSADGAERIDIPDSVAEALVETGHAAQEARGAGHADRRNASGGGDADSEFSWTADTKENQENQNLLTLLYNIAQDQAQRESYVHRGVTCNNCNLVPIRGIRYRCANCLDYDLCEQCEAIDSAHPRTHLFYKVRIPAPFLGNPRHAQTPWYPGKPQMMPICLGPDTISNLQKVTKFDHPELEALYEQYKCLAASEYEDKKYKIHAAISRDTFDTCFIPAPHSQGPAPNLIYDRVFAFYDTNSDGFIDFEEFVVGLAAAPSHNKSKTPEQLKRIFRGYDLDGDGYVDRADFLRMFKAFYALSKDLIKDVVASLGDELYDPTHMEGVLQGRQPVSAAFVSAIPMGARGFTKPPPGEGDDGTEDPDGPAVIPSKSETSVVSERKEDNTEKQVNGESALAREQPERKLGEEFLGLRDEDEELDLPDDERDVGNEVLYQMTVQGINELLDILFRAKERECQSPSVADDDDDAGATGGDGDDGALEPEAEAEIEAASTETSTHLEVPSRVSRPRRTQEGSETEVTTADTTGDAPAPPKKSDKKAAREAARREAKERGGAGRLNYKEFEAIMTGKERNRLRFVSNCFEIASF